jgi:hypothetical protein
MHIAETGIDNYPSPVIASGEAAKQSLENLWSAATVMLGRLGVPASGQPEALARVKKAIENTLSDEMGRWVLTDHLEARSEYAVSGMVDGKLVHARIDRTFVADGVRWVVDFKLSIHRGGDLDSFIEEQCERHHAQIVRYEKLLSFRGEVVEGRLYFPLLRRT